MDRYWEKVPDKAAATRYNRLALYRELNILQVSRADWADKEGAMHPGKSVALHLAPEMIDILTDALALCAPGQGG